MKHLLLDIETSPNVAHVWSLWNTNVSLAQLRESSYMMSWAAKWYGERRVEFRSVHHDGQSAMVERIHELMDEADVITHYNGDRFDVPTLNKEFLLAGMAPPAPSKHIDLFQVAKKRFRFPSNKLEYVSKAVGLAGKVQHGGHELWVKCLAGDDKAWSVMRRYNKQDVVLLEELYDRLLPWIENHPHRGFYDPAAVCPNCGDGVAQRRGYAHLSTGTYQRYQCACGSWYRGKQRVDSVNSVGLKL